MVSTVGDDLNCRPSDNSIPDIAVILVNFVILTECINMWEIRWYISSNNYIYILCYVWSQFGRTQFWNTASIIVLMGMPITFSRGCFGICRVSILTYDLVICCTTGSPFFTWKLRYNLCLEGNDEYRGLHDFISYLLFWYPFDSKENPELALSSGYGIFSSLSLLTVIFR